MDTLIDNTGIADLFEMLQSRSKGGVKLTS